MGSAAAFVRHAAELDAWTGFANAPTTDNVSWWQDLWRTDPGFITLGLKHILIGLCWFVERVAT